MLIRFAGDMAMMSPPLIITIDEIHEVSAKKIIYMKLQNIQLRHAVVVTK